MPLYVSYVTMGFPVAVETFACTDIRILRTAGERVTVHSMRAAPANGPTVLAQRGLEGLPVEYNTIGGYLRGILSGAKQPRLTYQATSWLVRTTWRHPKFLFTSLFLLPRALEIVSRLEAEKPDVVHLFWGHYPSIVAYLLRRRHSTVVISMFLGAYDLLYRYGPSALAAREADLVLTHAWHNVPDIEKLGVARERIVVVHRGVDLESFRPEGKKVCRRIVCASRLCVDKRVDDVLAVFATVFARWPDASLVIMGDGPDRPRLERLSRHLGIQEAVRFCGHVPHAIVRDEMAAAEFFMLMSREATERLTNATKEAMASGCVCVVTRSPGIEELLADGVHGILVEQGDIDAAARALTWAFERTAEAAEMRAAAARRIHGFFDVVRGMDFYRQRWLDLSEARLRGAAHSPATVLRDGAAVPLAERS